MVRVALIGFGGIAQAHRSAYDALAKEGVPVRLVAASDIRPEQFTKVQKINLSQESGDASAAAELHTYTDTDEMLRREQVDLVDICLPTYLHARYTIEMLGRGYNVLCEKPMSNHYEDCEKMLAAAKKSGKLLMIGQCVRFWGVYRYLKEAVEDGRFGKIRSLEMNRLSVPATWGFEDWFQDFDRSGGPIHDLHVHDLDFARYLLGDPDRVACRADSLITPFDAAYTDFFYQDGPIVRIAGVQQLVGQPFVYSYRAVFDKASLLMQDNELTVFPMDGSDSYKPAYSPAFGIPEELRYLVDLLENGKENLRNKPEDSAESIRLVQVLMESSRQGGVPLDFKK